MAIEIYDKAKVIKKDTKYYYLVKQGSKNSFTNPYQYVIGDDLRDKYMLGTSRDSTWYVIAEGGQEEYNADKIAYTNWNCSTSHVYGKIKFGNKKNIALALVKTKPTLYEELDERQQNNFNAILRYSGDYIINLSEIPEAKQRKLVENYCGKEAKMAEHSICYQGIEYWNLDNL